MSLVDNRAVKIVPVLAVSRPDWHLACKWLKWVSLLQHGEKQPQIVVFGAKALSDVAWTELKKSASGIVPSVVFRATPEVYERGYGASANFLFRTAIEMVEREYPWHAMLFCEADTVPTRSDWINDIQEEYRRCGKPFLGDVVRYTGGIAGIDHMTGVAVYHPDWRLHAPSLAALPGKRPDVGWDSQCSHETLPQAAQATTIQQIWRPPSITLQWARENIRLECALFHQCKNGALIDAFCELLGFPKIPLAAPLVPSSYPPSAPAKTTGSSAVMANAPVPVTEIFIVTFARDIEFLRYCLASLKLYAKGFAGVTVLVPEHEREQFNWIRRDVTVKTFVEMPGKGMLSHEAEIMRADEHCPNAEMILHLDADCMLFRKAPVGSFFTDGRAMMIREHYSRVKNPNRHIWRECVRNACGITPEFETMVAKPQIYPRGLYAEARRMIESHTGKNWYDYILSCRNEFPQGFAEFPTLGAIGIREMPWAFEFVEYDHEAEARELGIDPASFQYAYRNGRDVITEWWSHGGIAGYRSSCEAILRGAVAAYYVK